MEAEVTAIVIASCRGVGGWRGASLAWLSRMGRAPRLAFHLCALSGFVFSALVSAQVAADRAVGSAAQRGQVALVVGNAAYRNRPLLNPVHDATDVAARL